MAYDGKSWRVCLGYTDLKPTIMKFKYLAQALPKLDKDTVFMKAITKMIFSPCLTFRALRGAG
jgi:hypothetical protein